jgi:hypothetical protein
MESISSEVLLALVGVVVAGMIYFATIQRNKLQADETRLAAERLAIRTRIIEEYAAKYERRKDAGPHLLATLGLAQLRSDSEIRSVIDEIRRRVGHDPWEGAREFVEQVNLLAFFEEAAEKRVDFIRTPVSEFVTQLDASKRHAVVTALPLH